MAQVTTVPAAYVYVSLNAGMPCMTVHVSRCGVCVDMAAYVASTRKNPGSGYSADNTNYA